MVVRSAVHRIRSHMRTAMLCRSRFRSRHLRSKRPPVPTLLKERNWIDQTREEAMTKSRGCLECHQAMTRIQCMLIRKIQRVDSRNVVLGCTDCHGGNPTPGLTQKKSARAAAQSNFLGKFRQSQRIERAAQPRVRGIHSVRKSGRFARGRTRLWLCHKEAVDHVSTSMMRHGAMLWGAALYNNGADHTRITVSARPTDEWVSLRLKIQRLSHLKTRVCMGFFLPRSVAAFPLEPNRATFFAFSKRW